MNYIVATETEDVKPVLTVKTEQDNMTSTSYPERCNEGRYLEMSSKQEAVTRGRFLTKIIFELSLCFSYFFIYYNYLLQEQRQKM